MSGACRTIFGRLCRHFPPQSSALCGCSHGGSLGPAKRGVGGPVWRVPPAVGGLDMAVATRCQSVNGGAGSQYFRFHHGTKWKAEVMQLAQSRRRNPRLRDTLLPKKTMSPTSGSGDWGQNLDQQEPRQVNYRLDGSLGVGVVEFDNSADDKFPSLSISIRSKLASVAVRYSTSDII